MWIYVGLMSTLFNLKPLFLSITERNFNYFSFIHSQDHFLREIN